MEPEVHERANQLLKQIKFLKQHKNGFGTEPGVVNPRPGKFGIKRYFHNPENFVMGGSWSTNQSPDTPVGQTFTLSALNHTKLIDEFLGDWAEFEAMYFMRLDKKIAALEKEYANL